MNKHKLYAVPTWGSAIVELVFQYSNLPHEVEYLKAVDVKNERYLKINPLGQIPSLILPNGEVMTGSLAICLYVDAKGGANLVPPSDSRNYARFLRWCVFLVDAIYSQAAFADHPDWFVKDKAAQSELHEATLQMVQNRFLLMENEVRAPWFLGEKMSLIDVYLCIMTFWDPGRPWFEKNCPKIMANVDRLQATPEFKAVYENNHP